MFKVGQLVTGTNNNPYGITNENALCLVLSVNEAWNEITVLIVAHKYGDICKDNVDAEYFVPCTYAKFMERYPEAVLTSHYSAEELNKIKNDEIMEEKKMELRMDKEKFGSYELTSEERETLREQIFDLLEEYNYSPTDTGVNAILDEWIANKGWMINLFKQHPNYNGKFQIVFDSDYNRVCDKNILYGFKKYFYRIAKMILKPYKIGAFSYRETEQIYSKLRTTVSRMSDIWDDYSDVTANGRTYFEMRAERDKWAEKYRAYKNKYDSGEIMIYDGEAYEDDLWRSFNNLIYFSDLIYEYTESIADEYFAKQVNERFPTVKAVAGQKTSRIIGKVARLTGLDKDENWNREYAKYSDAINPLAIKRHTILSCHPIDYFTMSFGNSWASCHTIDKTNKRDMPNDYSGCYSSGTLSYMLDESSFVFYTVDKGYNEDKYELQDKINRNMFHMGEDKLIQARVYPQATDGESGIYKQIREIAQKVISDCLGVPNMWKNVKGTSECSRAIHSSGTHYRDYTNFDDCNVSYLKGEDDLINTNNIKVGHLPICPNCGCEHSHQEAIECNRCYKERHTCCECGCVEDEEHMHYIDGEWYCEEHCFYCNYHEEWEVGDDCFDIEDYGSVCNSAYYDSGYFYKCEYCDNYFHIGSSYHEHIETEDGKHFCCGNHAECDGYLEVDETGRWYPEDDVYFCEHCEQYVHADDWDSENNCCDSCAREISEAEIEEAVAEEIEEEILEAEEREAV